MDTDLGSPTGDRGHAPPDVVVAMLAGGDHDLGDASADRGDPEPAVVETMAAESAESSLELGEPTPDRGCAAPALASPFSARSPKQLFAVVQAVADIHTDPDRYGAVLIDPPADGSSAEGLRAGIGLFGQATGELGKVLRLMRDRDTGAFADTFGDQTDRLLTTLNAEDRESRLAPVGGANLWEGQWPQIFASAAAVPSYQYAQNEFAIEGRLRPIEATAIQLGLPGLVGIALVYERVVALGPEPGLRWVNRVVGRAPTGSESAVQRLRASSTQAGRLVIDQLASSAALAAADRGPDAGDVAPG